ncbi:helix-turn-helix domain-containing protein [Streptomyces qinzhouensis]|uniref:Helix-turn-helix domain-containing protein n=1 Tax=Streptomyces qinzhouensis TaxID=2599401 RepID=A0A5B8JD42_9ACTN|nr:helix-turn-helix domain-containing protein [Streptomyces qinzhouensis]QDY75590.1 helix-turn-helix domain-containing protein [Streptomyces qinzhouensis]
MNPAHSAETVSDSPVGALIRAHRLRIGLTQRELADLSTISVRAIRDLEHGRATRPRTDTVRLMADALRLGPRARAALEEAARPGRAGRTPAGPPAPPNAPKPLLGRETEVSTLVRELAPDGGECLVHLVGLPGVGKTRVALAAAAAVHGSGMPVLWHAFPGAAREYVPTAPGPWSELTDRLVAGLYESGLSRREPAGGESASALLGEGPVLLVLDGAPARAPRADRLTRLLHEVPGLRLLVTSDEPWQAPGERLFLLCPLPVPAGSARDTADGDESEPAVRMFLDQVRRVRATPAVTAADRERAVRICRLLDGHPGALSAAASWLVVSDLAALCDTLAVDPAAFLDHLGGRDDRLRESLYGRIGRLPEGPRAVLDALCAAPGPDSVADGFGLPALTGLTGGSLPECGRRLRELLLSGLVRADHEDGTARFRVPALVRALVCAAPTGAPQATAAV